MNFLSRIEETLLLSIWKLRDNAYGRTIREQVEKDTGIRWLSGAIYGPLNRLKKNEYIVARPGKEAGESGGRPRVYYELTPLGRKKMAFFQTVSRALWAGVSCLKNEFGGK